MSEPVSSVEIEDVLSSIRRLVSEEKRPVPLPEQAMAPARPEKLVLTSALRVADTPKMESFEQTAPSLAEPLLGPMDFESVPRSDKAEPEQEAQPVKQETASDEVFVSTSDDEAPLDELPAETQMSEDTDQACEPSEGRLGAPWHDPDTTLFEAAESLNPPETGEASGNSDPPEFPEQADTAEENDPVDSDVRVTMMDETPDASLEEANDGWTKTPADAGHAPDTPTLSAKIAALEAEIGRTQDQWEPDGDSGDDYAGTRVESIQWQDHDTATVGEPDVLRSTPSELTQTAPPLTEPAPQAASLDEHTPEDDVLTRDTLDVLAADDTILDEESLRDLVADIVREELQGALGERITRNVRKLVRREIHRALTAQQLD